MANTLLEKYKKRNSTSIEGKIQLLINHANSKD